MRLGPHYSGRGSPSSRSPVRPHQGPDLCFAPSGSRHLLVGCEQTKADTDPRRMQLRSSWRVTRPGGQRPGSSGLSPCRSTRALSAPPENTQPPETPLSSLRNSHAHITASPSLGVKHCPRRRRDFRNRRVTTSGRRRKRLSALRFGVLVSPRGPAGHRRGPLEVWPAALGCQGRGSEG